MNATAISLILAQLDEQAEEATTRIAGLKNTLLGAGFIVMIETVPLRFTIKDRVANNPFPASLGMATRFTQQDAEAIAAKCQNGNGTKGRAIHILQAYEGRLVEINATREFLATQQAA